MPRAAVWPEEVVDDFCAIAVVEKWLGVVPVAGLLESNGLVFMVPGSC